MASINTKLFEYSVVFSSGRVARFIFWGAVNTIVAYALYVICFWSFSSVMSSQKADIISLATIIILGYLLYSYTTFKVDPWDLKQFKKYVSLYQGGGSNEFYFIADNG